MKNIITILLILIIPVFVYLYLTNNSQNSAVIAKDNNLPTLMTFTSTMCMDCQKMKSVLSEIEPNYSDRVNFIHVQALDKSKRTKDAIKKYSVVLVPTIIVLDKNGNQIDKIEGFTEKEILVNKIEELLNE